MISSRSLAKSLYKELRTSSSPEQVFDAVIEKMKKDNPYIIERTLGYLIRLFEKEQKHNSLSIRFGIDPDTESIERVQKYVKSIEKPEIHIDDTLIGGFIAEHKGVVYDGSVRGYIQKLRNQLKATH